MDEKQLNLLGDRLAKALKMKRDPEHRDRWQTAWGTKTGTGLVLMLKRAMAEIESGNLDLLASDARYRCFVSA